MSFGMTKRKHLDAKNRPATGNAVLTPGRRRIGLEARSGHTCRTKLLPGKKALDASYQAACTESWRNTLSSAWGATETEGWPE
jgi:hypothetical protein